ncbi:MAG: hypothetical protein HZA66_24125 [Rhodopseudomonas palustris]|uniref:Uncharacterized protein n=1 Tax=Rhodopseudomonas palustris TaxID=1076 RepID=A0A933S2M8_RHOPL|nr:hypothetical protein [Rhodopseudomonas palustris]
MRIPTAIIGCLALAGCSSILESIPEPADQAPSITSASADIKRIASEAKLTEPLEVAGPIEANPTTVAPWIICVRSSSPDQSRQTYALFYRNLKLVSSRLSAIVDRCELQTFARL